MVDFLDGVEFRLKRRRFACGKGAMISSPRWQSTISDSRRSPRAQRVAPEKFADQPAVQIGAHFHDRLTLKAAEPAIVVVEAHAVAGRRHRAQLDDRPVAVEE